MKLGVAIIILVLALVAGCSPQTVRSKYVTISMLNGIEPHESYTGAGRRFFIYKVQGSVREIATMLQADPALTSFTQEDEVETMNSFEFLHKDPLIRVQIYRGWMGSGLDSESTISVVEPES